MKLNYRHCEAHRAEAIQPFARFKCNLDCFAEPVIGRRIRADPLARNDDGADGILLQVNHHSRARRALP